MNKIDERPGVIQLEHTVSAWGTALSQLAMASQLDEALVADAASKGAVWKKKHNAHKLRRVRDLAEHTAVSDQLFLNYDADVLAQIPLKPILISDQVNYSIWNKPAGMLSQGSKWSDHCTITQTVQNLHGKSAFLVHRLDKAASGLIVIAHTKNAVKKLADLFAQRLIEKHYTVRVHGHFNLALPHRLDTPVDDKAAITDVLELNYDSDTDVSTLLISISTGRKHQIRNHLFSIGFPVVGDRLFDVSREHVMDLQLTASSLAFECPFTNKKQHFHL